MQQNTTFAQSFTSHCWERNNVAPKNLFSIQSSFLKIIILFYFDCELEVQLGQLFSKEQILCETLSREDASPISSSL